MLTATTRPLPPDAIAGLSSIPEACDVLRAWGHPDLADRLAYLASDADLDDGDRPANLESARGFLAFFGAIESAEGRVDLGTSWDGTICADWRFPDERIVAVWFVDGERVRYSACKSDGRFIDLGRDYTTASDVYHLARRLVDMKEWFTWFRGNPVGANSRHPTT